MRRKELEVAILLQRAELHCEFLLLIRLALLCITLLATVWVSFEGLVRIFAGRSAEGIAAIAKVIEALNVGSLFAFLSGASASSVWHFVRAGKKRDLPMRATPKALRKLLKGDDHD